MNLTMMGINFKHKKGEFCQKAKFSQYTICCFLTPFSYHYDGEMLEGKAGDIIINTPGQIVYHGPRAESNEGFVNDWMYIEGDEITELLEKYPLPLNKAFSIGNVFFVRKYFNSLFSEFNSETIGSFDMIKSIITQMIIAMHRAYNQQNFCDKSFNEITTVRRAIINNPEKKWTLKQMSDMSGYSVSRFCELYKKLYNISPVNDVIVHRISLANAVREFLVNENRDALGTNAKDYYLKHFTREKFMDNLEQELINPSK